MSVPMRMVCALAVLLFATVFPATAGQFKPTPRNGVPGVYMVLLNDGVARKAGKPANGLPEVAQVARELANAHGATLRETWEYGSSFVVVMPEARARKLAEDPRVQAVEQDAEVSAPFNDCYKGTSFPDSPRNQLPPITAPSEHDITCTNPDPAANNCQDNWGLDRIDQVEGELDGTFHYKANGTGVHAYILDTGIKSDHREFHDANGVTRVSGGVDATTDPPTPGDGDADCQGHGTHVASILAGRSYGVAKNATIHPLRFGGHFCADEQGSQLTRMARALNWMIGDVLTNNHRPALVNWSGGNKTAADSLTLRALVRTAIANNITVVQSAGNQGRAYDSDLPHEIIDACTETMGDIDGVIVAGGIDYDQPTNGRWTRDPASEPDLCNGARGTDCGSNVGACIDVWAPAAHVLAAYYKTTQKATCTLSGTSMAAPHVAGVAALYLQHNPNATPLEVERALRSRGVWGKLESNETTTNQDGEEVPVGDYIGDGSDNVLVFADTLAMGTDEPPVARITYTCSGRTCTFSGTSSTDNGSITNYAWWFTANYETFEDSGSTVSRTFATYGDVVVVLGVKDNTGKTDHLRQTFKLSTDPMPTASFTSSCSGLTCTFDSTASTDNGSITRSWAFGDAADPVSGITVTHTFPRAAIYAVTLTVTDNLAQTATKSQNVPVGVGPNNPPTANFTPFCTGLLCSFTSTSTDDGTITAYAWTFGDGSSGSGATVSRRYAAAGAYLVTLTVTDNGGLTGTASQTVNVTNNPPVADFSHTCSGLTCSFNGSSSTDDGNSIAAYSWNFGDGSALGSGVTTSRTYAAPGTYAVTLTVTDSAGLTGTPRTKNVTVTATNNPPTANFTFNCSGVTCSFDGSSSTDDGGIASYSWSFGDAGSGSGVTTTHTYPSLAFATYAVTLTVTDTGGQQATKTKKVSVTNDPLPAAYSYFAVKPCRALDTRNTTILSNNQPRTVAMFYNCGVPLNAAAVAVNVTAISPTGSGTISVYPTSYSSSSPGAKATVNFTPARSPRSNSAVIRLPSNGVLAINALVSGTPGQVHVLLDVEGYYSTATTAPSGVSGPLGFQTVTPCRFWDTRQYTPLQNDKGRSFTVQTRCGIPMGSGAVAMHVGVVTPAYSGSIKVFQYGIPVPATTTLNFNAGIGNLRNGAYVKPAAMYQADVVTLFNSGTPGAQVHATYDTHGYFKSDAPMKYYPITPCRTVDTADAAMGGPALVAGTRRNFAIRGNCGVPATAKAALVRLVASAPTSNGELTLWASHLAQPAISTMVFDANEPALSLGTIVPLSTLNEDLAVLASGMNAGGTVALAIEVFGYFQ